MVKSLGRLLALPMLALVWVYRLAISPWLGNNCRYEPSCSEYAMDALSIHGSFQGRLKTSKRNGRKQPWGGSGYDPVPEKHEDRIAED